MDLINRGAAFFHGFMTAYGDHRLSYRENKVVPGRLGARGEVIDVTLLADKEGGLYGFRG